jgi:STE24 endopeptidase
MMVGVISTFVGLFVAAKLYSWSATYFHFQGIAEIAGLPLLGLWLTLFGLVTSPLGNLLSRKHEREADAYAVETTRNAPSFVSALRKLESTNLADPVPHPWEEFFFYSHPAIGKRVRMIEALGVRR